MRIVNAADVHVGWCRESTITSPFRPQHYGPFTAVRLFWIFGSTNLISLTPLSDIPSLPTLIMR